MTDPRLSRQELLPGYELSGTVLAAKRVGVIGAGGLGGLCAYLLAGAGVGELRLADGDVVSLSNLHRQVLYDMDSLGKSKVQCAAARIKALNPEVKTISYGELKAQDVPSFAQGLDLLLLLTDNLQSRVELSAAAMALRLDTLISCVSGFEGMQLAAFYSRPDFVADYGCYRCLCASSINEDGRVQEPLVQGILGPAAAQMASATAQTALQILCGQYPPELYGKVSLYDLKRQQVRQLKLRRNPGCPECMKYANNL